MISELTEKILMALMIEGVARVNALKLLDKNEGTVLNRLAAMEDKGFIKSKVLSVKGTTKTKIKIHYKEITRKGVQFLRDNCCDKYYWLGELPEVIPKFTVSQTSKADTKLRILNNVSITIMLKMCGIHCECTRLRSSTRTKAVHFKDMVYDAKTYYQFAAENQYIWARDMGKAFHLKNDDIKQNKFSNHMGLIIHNKHSYITYAIRPDGLKINRNAAEKLQVGISVHYSMQLNEQWKSKITALLFYNNMSELKTMFNSAYEKVKKRKKDDNIALADTCYYIKAIPVTRQGLTMLKRFLDYNGDYNHFILKKLPDEHEGISEEIGHEEMFYNNSSVYVGLEVDIIQLLKIKKKADTSSNEIIYLICDDTYKTFYKEIIPGNVMLWM